MKLTKHFLTRKGTKREYIRIKSKERTRTWVKREGVPLAAYKRRFKENSKASPYRFTAKASKAIKAGYLRPQEAKSYTIKTQRNWGGVQKRVETRKNISEIFRMDKPSLELGELSISEMLSRQRAYDLIGEKLSRQDIKELVKKYATVMDRGLHYELTAVDKGGNRIGSIKLRGIRPDSVGEWLKNITQMAEKKQLPEVFSPEKAAKSIGSLLGVYPGMPKRALVFSDIITNDMNRGIGGWKIKAAFAKTW